MATPSPSWIESQIQELWKRWENIHFRVGGGGPGQPGLEDRMVTQENENVQQWTFIRRWQQLLDGAVGVRNLETRVADLETWKNERTQERMRKEKEKNDFASATRLMVISSLVQILIAAIMVWLGLR